MVEPCMTAVLLVLDLKQRICGQGVF